MLNGCEASGLRRNRYFGKLRMTNKTIVMLNESEASVLCRSRSFGKLRMTNKTIVMLNASEASGYTRDEKQGCKTKKQDIQSCFL